MTELNKQKNIFRDKSRYYYSQLNAECKSAKDEKIFNALINSNAFKTATSVFLFYSVKNEIDTLSIIDYCLKCNKQVCLPLCYNNKSMDFFEINSLNNLKAGTYNIPAPDTDICKKAVISENAICIVPGWCFDKQGYRIGKGAGYYDRYLRSNNIMTIGLCYDDLLFDKVPVDEYDIPVNSVITENSIYNTKLTKG